MSSATGVFLEECLRRGLQHPSTTPHRADRVGSQHSAYTDQDRVAAPLAEVLEADPASELASADHLPGIFCQGEENSPLLCAQMSEGVGDIRGASRGETGHRSGAEHWR